MKQYTDLHLNDKKWILDKIECENVHQIVKFGEHTTHTAFRWLSFVTEELGEVAKAINDYNDREGGDKEERTKRSKVVKEAIQVATLALKIAEMFEKE